MKQKRTSFFRRFFAIFGGGAQYNPNLMQGNALQGGVNPLQAAEKFAGGLSSYRQPIKIDLKKMRSQSRLAMLDAVDLIALAKTLKTLVIGSGLRFSSAPESFYLTELAARGDEYIKDVRRKIDSFWQICYDSTVFDITHQRSLSTLMSDIFESWLVDGEVFLAFNIVDDGDLTPLRIKMILPESVKNPGGVVNNKTLADGIEFDEHGQPIAYYVDNERIDRYGKESKRIQILHLKNGQMVRGIPFFAAVLQEAKLLQDYQMHELQKMALGSQIFMGATGNMAQKMDVSGIAALQQSTPLQPSGFVDLGRAGVNLLKINDNSTLVDLPTPRPADKYAEFVSSQHQRMSAGMGLPASIVNKKIDASYSAARFEAQLTELEVVTYREKFIDSFLKPLWQEWFKLSVADNIFSFVVNFSRKIEQEAWMSVEILGRSLPDLNPYQEAKALQLLIETGLLSRSDAAKVLGLPKFEDTLNTLKKENNEMSGMAKNEIS